MIDFPLVCVFGKINPKSDLISIKAFVYHNSKTVSFVVFVSLIGVKSQDFCESYKKNNHSLLVYSQSNDIIVLIVGRHFWKLREYNSGLVFDRKDFQASNSSEQWTESNFVSAYPLYNRGLYLIQESKNMTPVGIKLLNQ